MSWIECGSCEEMVDVCGGTVRLPYICGRCEKDSALAIEEEDNVLCDAPYNSGVPCQNALDSMQDTKQYSPAIQTRLVHHEMDICDQFDADSELIADLRDQLDEAHAANASLTYEIDLCDGRVRAYQMLSAEVDKYAANQETKVMRLNADVEWLKARLEMEKHYHDFFKGRLTRERNRTWFEKLFGWGT
jgi:hypothetical protein